MVAPAIINFEGNFARKYFVNFWENEYFGKTNHTNWSVIGMVHYFDIKHYPIKWGIKYIHYSGGSVPSNDWPSRMLAGQLAASDGRVKNIFVIERPLLKFSPDEA